MTERCSSPTAALATMHGAAPYGLIDGWRDRARRAAGSPGSGRRPTCRGARPARRAISAAGSSRPALIDCHTHIVHGGDRARGIRDAARGRQLRGDRARRRRHRLHRRRHARRDRGRRCSPSALPRLDALIAEGVTTIEVKSGYGLDVETELRMLRAARRLGDARPVRVRTSFLGAHAVPPEYEGRPDAYIDEVCLPALRAAHAEGLVDAVDGFCEGIAFSPDQIARVFDAAQRARPAGEAPCRAALQPRRRGARGRATGRSRPTTSNTRREDDAARDGRSRHRRGHPARRLLHPARDAAAADRRPSATHGVPMAVATDCNPGSSPLTSLLLAMNMACTLFRMTPEEALAGVTAHAARALGLADRGTHRAGPARRPRRLGRREPGRAPYRIGFNPLHTPHLRRPGVTHDPRPPAATDPRRSSRRTLARRRAVAARPRRRPAVERRRRRGRRRPRRGARRSTASTPASASSPSVRIAAGRHRRRCSAT